jgi:hypothetical protein
MESPNIVHKETRSLWMEKDGLPYEFYLRFWPVVWLELAGMLQKAFSGGEGAAATADAGVYHPLVQGKGADRESPASYRPITLLNTDYKLAARAIASRIGPLRNQVVDATRQASCPSAGCGISAGRPATWKTHNSQECRSSWTSRRPSIALTGPGLSGAWLRWASGPVRSGGAHPPARPREWPSTAGTPMPSSWPPASSREAPSHCCSLCLPRSR